MQFSIFEQQTAEVSMECSRSVQSEEGIQYNIGIQNDSRRSQWVLLEAFLTHLIEIGFLKRGDILVVDNYTIYMDGWREWISACCESNEPGVPWSSISITNVVGHNMMRLEPSVRPEEFEQDIIQVFSSFLFSSKSFRKK